MRAGCCVARRVRHLSGAREMAVFHDVVLFADRLAVQPALQNLAGSRGVPRLRGEACARNVWLWSASGLIVDDEQGSIIRPSSCRHRIVRHRSPRVVSCRRLREPNIT